MRSTGTFAACLFGVVWDKVTPRAGLYSIIAGTVISLGWQIAKEPFGIMAVIAGSVASLLTFLIVNKIELNRGVPAAPSAYNQDNQIFI